MGEYLNDDFIIINPKKFPTYIENYDSKNEFLKSMIDDWLNYKEITQGSPVLD
jgi:hypothetical protein